VLLGIILYTVHEILAFEYAGRQIGIEENPNTAEVEVLKLKFDEITSLSNFNRI